MMEASAAVENRGTEILSNTYNLQNVPYGQFLVRAYVLHKTSLKPGFEGVAAVSGIIRRDIVNSSRRETRGGIGCNL
jgi:hypothetical protein